MSAATLAAVARQAGVSVSTASRVLNKAPGSVPISTGTVDKVRSAADALGYVPNAAARMLRTGRSRCIGVLGANPAFFAARGPFTGEIMAGLMRAGVELGYHTTLLTGWEHFVEGGDIHADLGSADGLLVLNRDLYQAPAHLEAIRRCRIPVVYALEYPADDADAVFASPDDVQGGRLAVEQLVAAGHRRIGFARSPEWQGIFGRRQQGWADGLLAAGITPDEAWVFDATPTPERTRELGLTAFVGANEPIGRDTAASMAAGGLAVEVVVFGHRDHQGRPFGTSAMVSHDLSECIARSVGQLVGLIEGRAIEHQIRMPMSYHPGAAQAAG